MRGTPRTLAFVFSRAEAVPNAEQRNRGYTENSSARHFVGIDANVVGALLVPVICPGKFELVQHERKIGTRIGNSGKPEVAH